MDAASENIVSQAAAPPTNVQQAFKSQTGNSYFKPQDNYPQLFLGDQDSESHSDSEAQMLSSKTPNGDHNSAPLTDLQEAASLSSGSSSNTTTSDTLSTVPVMGYPVMNSVIGPQYCLPYTANFELVRSTGGHLSSSVEWHITDAAGDLVLKVNGHRGLSVHGDMELIEEATGKSLVHMKRKGMSLHDTWHMYSGQGPEKQLLCDVKRTTIMPNSWPSMNVFLASNMYYNSATPNFHVEGKYYEKHVLINCGQLPFAEVWRKANLTQVVIGKDTFEMKVFAAADYAFAAALVVLMDEMYLHQNGQKVVTALVVGASVTALVASQSPIL